MGYSRYSDEEAEIGLSMIRNLVSQIRIEVDGDFLRGQKVIDRLPAALKAAAFKAQLKFAEKYKANLRRHIRDNGKELGWAPYSKGYVRYKRAIRKKKSSVRYGPESMWRFQGHAYNSIEITKDPIRNRVSVGISRENGKMNLDGELTVSQYINIVEHGSHSRNIKKRPLFGPTFKLMGGQKALSRMVQNEIERAIKNI